MRTLLPIAIIIASIFAVAIVFWPASSQAPVRTESPARTHLNAPTVAPAPAVTEEPKQPKVFDWFDEETCTKSQFVEHEAWNVKTSYWLYRTHTRIAVLTEFEYVGDKPVDGKGFGTVGSIQKAKALGIEISVDSKFTYRPPKVSTSWNKVVRPGDTCRNVGIYDLPDKATNELFVDMRVNHYARSTRLNEWHPIGDFISVSEGKLDSIR